MVVLIRSGRTEWDEAGRLQGGTDLPACAEGLGEVERSLEAWAARGGAVAGLVCGGTDEGSRETAKLAGDVFGAKVKSLEGLAAMGMGLWEGLTAEDLEERHPTSYKQWREHPSRVRVPEGEGVGAFAERSLGALLRLMEKHPKKGLGLVLRPFEFAMMDRVLSGRGALGLTEEDLAGVGDAVVSHEVSAASVREAIEGLVERV